MTEQNKLTVAIKSLNTEIEYFLDQKSLSLLNKESKKIRNLLTNNSKTMAKEIEEYNKSVIKINEQYKPEKIIEIISRNNEIKALYIEDLNNLIQSAHLVEKHLKGMISQEAKQKEEIAEMKKVEELKLWIEVNKELLAKTILKSKKSNKGLTNNSIIKAIKEIKTDTPK